MIEVEDPNVCLAAVNARMTLKIFRCELPIARTISLRVYESSLIMQAHIPIVVLLAVRSHTQLAVGVATETTSSGKQIDCQPELALRTLLHLLNRRQMLCHTYGALKREGVKSHVT